MIRLFVGYDGREAAGLYAFMESLIARTSAPFSITPLHGELRDGSNAFTYERFMVPYLCGFEGTAIFMDGSDMLMRADIAELAALADPAFAVQCVQRDYRTAHPQKYIGTAMESPNIDYPRKNWSSVVIWNCGHPNNRILTPAYIRSRNGPFLHRFSWLLDEQIGALPAEWNVLIGEGQNKSDAKVAHFTLGVPGIEFYRNDRYAEEWKDAVLRSSRVPK